MGFNFSDLAFLQVPKKDITIDGIRLIFEDGAPRRIAFATTHAGALKRGSGDRPGKILLPFKETVLPFIIAELGNDMALFPSKFGGYWRSFDSPEEYDKFEAFIRKYHDVVFLRDELDLSLALSMNFEEDEEGHTEIGDLECKAKYSGDSDAESKLVDKCAEWIGLLPYYKHVDYICAVPGKSGAMNLPQRIVSKFDTFNFKDISSHVYWRNKTRHIKDAESVDEKLEILDESGLNIDADIDLNGKTVLLFDDLYMSGLTMQYVAMKLKERGVSRVLGIAIVKSRKNK